VVDSLLTSDNLSNVYYVKEAVLHKKNDEESLTYSNLHLGDIFSIDITNPMKIVVFYKDFNAVVLLDDKLNELTDAIDFNTEFSKNISYVGTATDASLWLFSADDNSLQIWNYKTKKTTINTVLLNDFKFELAASNYQYIWLISDKDVHLYNVYGSFIKQFDVDSIKKAKTYNNGLLYLTKDTFFYTKDNRYESLLSNVQQQKTDFKKANFSIKNDSIYFFNGKSINKMALSKK
jgi:hypothetical protein